MRTPRQILLHRHRHVEPALDRLRRDALAQALPRVQRAEPLASGRKAWLPPGCWLLWEDAVRPWRFAWMGLAAAWVTIFGLHLAGGGAPAPASSARAVTATPELRAELESQQRWYAEFLDTPTEEPRKSPPGHWGPRSETRPAGWVKGNLPLS